MISGDIDQVRLPPSVAQRLTTQHLNPKILRIEWAGPYDYKLAIRKPAHECNPDYSGMASSPLMVDKNRPTRQVCVFYCKTCGEVDPLTTNAIVRILRRIHPLDVVDS